MIWTSRFFLIVSLLLHSLVAIAGGRDPSFLLSKLLKPSAFEVSLSDLGDVAPALRGLNGPLPALSDLRARFNTISKLPIEEIIAAPGHRLLRNPKQVDGLVNYISSSGGGSFVHDKLLLNVVTDASGKILSVDLWNAHHRMVAYMKAGYRT